MFHHKFSFHQPSKRTEKVVLGNQGIRQTYWGISWRKTFFRNVVFLLSTVEWLENKCLKADIKAWEKPEQCRLLPHVLSPTRDLETIWPLHQTWRHAALYCSGVFRIHHRPFLKVSPLIQSGMTSLWMRLGMLPFKVHSGHIFALTHQSFTQQKTLHQSLKIFARV